jgi:hypothetical protein
MGGEYSTRGDDSFWLLNILIAEPKEKRQLG